MNFQSLNFVRLWRFNKIILGEVIDMNKYYYGEGIVIALIIFSIISVLGGIAIYFTFLSKRNEGKFEGVLGWIYNFLNFKKLFLNTIIKITYIIFTVNGIFYSLILLIFGEINFLEFISIILGSIISIRVLYEFILIGLLICQNISEINEKLSNKTINKECFIDNDLKKDNFEQDEIISSNSEEKKLVFCRKCDQPYDSSLSICPYCGERRE